MRVDSGVGDGSEISVHYDPMIAKVVAHAPTREEAALTLAQALAEAEIYGPATNRRLLVRILRSPEFLAGETDTQFIDRIDVVAMSAPLTADHRLHALAATLAGQQGRREGAAVLGTIPSGWRNAPSQLQIQEWDTPQGVVAVGYLFGRNGLNVQLDGQPVETVLHSATPDVVDMTASGIRRRYRVARVARQMWVSSPLGHTALIQISRFPEPEVVDAPGSLLSPMPGKVVQVTRSEGDAVAAGDVVVVIEAMKMEHTVRSPSDGVVSSIRGAVDLLVDADQVLAVVEELATE